MPKIIPFLKSSYRSSVRTAMTCGAVLLSVAALAEGEETDPVVKRWIGATGQSVGAEGVWEELTGDGAYYLLNNGAEVVVGKGDALETAAKLYIGRGRAKNEDGTWSDSGSFDHGGTLTVDGGSVSVDSEVWVGGGYSDDWDSTLNILSGSFYAKNLWMGSCGSNEGQQGRPKTCRIHLKGGTCAATDVKVGNYMYSTSEIVQDGGTFRYTGSFELGLEGPGTFTFNGGVFEPGAETMVGSGGWEDTDEHGRGTMNINASVAFKTMHLGRYSGTGVVNVNAGTTVFKGDDGNGNKPWYDTLNLGWGKLSKGTLNIAQGATVQVQNAGTFVARDENTVGVINNAGTFEDWETLRIGNGKGSVGTFNNSGTVTVRDLIQVGANEGATGELVLTDGRIELGEGREFQICAGKNATGLVKVLGGELVTKGAWFCVGRSVNEDEDNHSVATLLVDGGKVTHLANGAGNFTIGTLGSDSCESSVILKEGEIYTTSEMIVGELHPGLLTVSGGRLTSRKIRRTAKGSYSFSGGTFATCEEIDGWESYFQDFEDPVVLGGNGIVLDANGHTMRFNNKIVGKVSIVPGDGLVKLDYWDAETANSGCEVAPVVTEEGTVTIKVALGTATKAVHSADGRFLLAWENAGENTYNVTATKDPIVSAVWTNASGDGDVANPLNWSATTASGVTATAVPETTTAVTVPYAAELPDFSAVEKASLVYALSGAVAPRGTVTVPQVVTRAIAWYDFNDAATISTGEYGEPTVSNKGAAGTKYDLAYSEWSWNPSYHPEEPLPVYAETQRNGRNVMSFKNSFGFRSKEEMPGSEEQSLTLVSVGVRQAQRYLGENGSYNDEFFPVAVEKDYWTEEGPYARIEQWSNNSVYCRVGNYIAEGYQDGENTRHWKVATAAANPGLPSDQFAVLSLTCDARELTAKSSIWTEEEGLRQSGPVELNSGSRNTPAGMKISVGERILWRSRSAGELAEVLVFDTAISDEELAAVRAYLQAKWFRAPDPALATIAAEGFVFTGENASLDLGQVATGFTSVEGAGTIANGDVTITEKVGAGLVVGGSLTLAEGATMDLSALLAQPLNTEVTLLTAAEIVRAPTFVGGENANRKVRILPVTDDAGRIVAYRGTVVSKGFCVLVR